MLINDKINESRRNELHFFSRNLASGSCGRVGAILLTFIAENLDKSTITYDGHTWFECSDQEMGDRLPYLDKDAISFALQSIPEHLLQKRVEDGKRFYTIPLTRWPSRRHLISGDEIKFLVQEAMRFGISKAIIMQHVRQRHLVSSIPQASKATGIPKDEVKSQLEELVKIGFCRKKYGSYSRNERWSDSELCAVEASSLCTEIKEEAV